MTWIYFWPCLPGPRPMNRMTPIDFFCAMLHSYILSLKPYVILSRVHVTREVTQLRARRAMLAFLQEGDEVFLGCKRIVWGPRQSGWMIPKCDTER